jgi:hypothetical protein
VGLHARKAAPLYTRPRFASNVANGTRGPNVSSPARIDWPCWPAAAPSRCRSTSPTALVLIFGFDDHAHVFIAGVQPWAHFLRELAWDAHPPLSYLLLRWLVPLQGAELWPRLLSILPALGTVVLAFLCARALGMARPVTWLVALIFAVSSTHVNLAISVRAYSLATFFTLGAYFFLVRLLRDPRTATSRDRWGFVVAAILASWSEYSGLWRSARCWPAWGLQLALDRDARAASARPGGWVALLVLAAGSRGRRRMDALDTRPWDRSATCSTPSRWPASPGRPFALRGARARSTCSPRSGSRPSTPPWLVVPAVLGALLWLATDRRHAPLARSSSCSGRRSSRSRSPARTRTAAACAISSCSFRSSRLRRGSSSMARSDASATAVPRRSS